MPFKTDYDPDDRVLYTRITGRVTFEDIDDHIRTMARLRTDFDASCPELIDAREAEGTASSRDLLLIAHRASVLLSHLAGARRAVVVSSDAQFATARRFACYVSGWLRLGVFDDMALAREWLIGRPARPASQPSQRPASTANAHVSV